MITLVGTPDPEPVPGAWSWDWSCGTPHRRVEPAIPWLRLDRNNTVPLTSAASGGWLSTNTFFTINPEGSPA